MKEYKVYLTLLTCFFMIKVSSAQEYQLRSPNGHLQIKIVNGSPLHFSLLQEGQVLIPSVSVDMELGSGAVLPIFSPHFIHYNFLRCESP